MAAYGTPIVLHQASAPAAPSHSGSQYSASSAGSAYSTSPARSHSSRSSVGSVYSESSAGSSYNRPHLAGPWHPEDRQEVRTYKSPNHVIEKGVAVVNRLQGFYEADTPSPHYAGTYARQQ